MNQRRPPRLAVWLLRRSGVAAWNAPLIGDMLEEFHQGRSSSWYWRQTGAAILSAFGRGLRISRLDILPWFAGWCAETAVLIGLWLFHVPFGFHSALPAGIAFGSVWLAMYLDYRIRLYLWRNESEMSDEESSIFWERRIGTRFMALGAFGTYLLIDGVFGLLGIVPSLRISLPWLVACHAFWICGQVVRAAMGSAGEAKASR